MHHNFEKTLSNFRYITEQLFLLYLTLNWKKKKTEKEKKT